MDIAFVATLLGAFAVAITCHIALAVGLARRRSFTRGLLALLLPPVAIAWGLASRMWVRSIGCALGIAVYGSALLAGAR